MGLSHKTYLIGSLPFFTGVASFVSRLAVWLLSAGNTPQVTVVITSFNHAAFVGEAIESVLNQTYPAERVIVVDDGSTDLTRTVLETYSDRVEIVLQENAGVIATRNRALSMVETDWIVYLDADDQLLRGFIRATTTFAMFPRSQDLAFVYTPARLSGIATGHSHSSFWDPARLAAKNFVANTCLMRVEALRAVHGYNTDLANLSHEDWDLFVRLAKAGWRGRLLPRPLFIYRIQAQGRNMSGKEETIKKYLAANYSVPPPRQALVLRWCLRKQAGARMLFWRRIDSLISLEHETAQAK